MKKNRILVVGSIPPPYHGSNIYLQELLNSKINEKFSISHLDTSDHRNDLDNLGKFDFLNVYLGIKNLFQLIYFCLQFKPALVYLCPAQGNAYWRDGLFIFIAKIFSGAKMVIHLHGSDFYNFYKRSNLLLNSFVNFSLKMVDKVIVLGESLKIIFRDWFSEEQIAVLPNGIDLNITLNNKFDRKKIPNLYFLGNLLKFKGIHTVLEAVALVKKTYKTINLRVAGKWGYDPIFNQDKETIKNELDEIISNYKLEDNIKFLGPILGKEKIELLQSSDIFIYPSINEGLPLVILEAMAAGNPVIAIDGVGAIPDVVVDGKTGILVKHQNPQEVADAIIYLIERPDIRIKMGREARERYEKYYTKEKHIEKMIAVFKKTLKEH